MLRRSTLALSRRVRSQRALTTFYDSQSGRYVTLPTGIQCHVSLAAVAVDRAPSALKHLKKDGKRIRGLASVLRATVHDEEGATQAALAGQDVWVAVSSLPDGIAAVRAAQEAGAIPRALLDPALCVDAHDVELSAAELSDAGAEAILLTVDAAMDEDDLRDVAEAAFNMDVLGLPVQSRLGLSVAPQSGVDAYRLMKFAHKDLGMLHFMSCLAGKQAPKPSELLKALGVRPADAAFGNMYLAEHVPDAA